MRMRMPRTKVLAAAAGALLWVGILPASARAQAPAAPVTLTMDEAVLRAVEHAPRLAEARERETAATTSVTALRALGYPTASVSAQYLRSSHVYEFSVPDGTGGTRVLFPDFPNMYKARAEVSMPIYSFGRISSNVAAAESDVHAAAADRLTVEADVRLDAMRAYWLLATLREAAKVLEESLARTDAQVSDVRARVDTGFLPPNDLLSAQAQRARQQVRLLQARNDEAIAELDLARIIGLPGGTPIQIGSPFDQALPGATTATAAPVDDLVGRAIAHRSERAGLTARGDGLRESAKATIANLKPYLLSSAFVEPARPNIRFLPPEDVWRLSWAFDVRFVWPLFDSGRTKAQAAGLSAQARAVDARRTEFDDLISLEIRQRVLEIQSGKAAIAASDDAVTAAAEARRVLDERFRAGVATSTEVLDAQVALLEAQLERTRLSAGLRLSEARLLRALGER